MKTKIALLLTICLLTGSVIGCNNTKEEVSTTETTTLETFTEETTKNEVKTEVEYTEEQLAFIEEYNNMVEYYNVLAVDSINASDLINDQELVATMNSLTQSIEAMGEVCDNPRT